jgi:hypothetical protein
MQNYSNYKYVLLCYIGRVKLKVDPLPSELLWAHILPPCASIIFFEIKSPKPVPTTDFEVNFVNSLGNISGSIP